MQDPVSTGDKTGHLSERLALEKTLGQPSVSATTPKNSSPTEENSLPISDELLKVLTAAIEQLYKERLGKPPQQVNCNLLSDRLVVWIEGSITPVEKLLFAEGTYAARKLCFTVDELMYRQITRLIERHLGVSVTVVVADTCYKHNCTGMIAQLLLCSETLEVENEHSE